MQSSRQKAVGSRVLGIDPGFDRFGVAVLEGERLLYSACISTNRTDTHEKRLFAIAAELSKIIKKWRPKAMAMEKIFFNQNVNTALKVAEARGVALLEAAKSGLGVYEYSPQDVKIAVTGYGRAEKRQVVEMTIRILELKEAPRHDDEADAMAVGITHIASHKAEMIQIKRLGNI